MLGNSINCFFFKDILSIVYSVYKFNGKCLSIKKRVNLKKLTHILLIIITVDRIFSINTNQLQLYLQIWKFT